MPANRTRNTLARQWELLKLLPTRGPGKTAKEIAESLSEAGFAISKRQIERDLLDLQEVFGLECNDASIPYGWRWGTTPVELPGVTLAEALSLQIVEDMLKPLLPTSVLRTMQPRFIQAKAKLAAMTEHSKSAQWAEKVCAVPPTLPTLPPDVDEDILETVQSALLEDEQVEVTYAPLANDLKTLSLHPLGLVVRGSVTYLVATAFDYADVRLYALHRFHAASRTYMPAQRPPGFNLSQYIDDGALQFGNGTTFKLVARIDELLAKRLTETPLSPSQKINVNGSQFELEATVIDSWQLHWWILSQGDAVTVIAPAALKNHIQTTLQAALTQYR